MVQSTLGRFANVLVPGPQGAKLTRFSFARGTVVKSWKRLSQKSVRATVRTIADTVLPVWELAEALLAIGVAEDDPGQLPAWKDRAGYIGDNAGLLWLS
jgi:hypothetical protein